MHHTEGGRTLTNLIRERLPGKRFGVFYATGEGDFFPNGVEEASGHVVDDEGRHYTFWTSWSHARSAVEFGWWYDVEPSPEDLAGWQDSEEYRDARRQAGLTG